MLKEIPEGERKEAKQKIVGPSFLCSEAWKGMSIKGFYTFERFEDIGIRIVRKR